MIRLEPYWDYVPTPGCEDKSFGQRGRSYEGVRVILFNRFYVVLARRDKLTRILDKPE
jgi:hypothetical protein